MKKPKELSEEERAHRLKMARAIRAHRERAGLTQQVLATRLGRSLANVRQWERENPPAAVPGGAIAQALARELGATMDELHISGTTYAVVIGDDTGMRVGESITEYGVAYPSLQEFLDEHAEDVTPDEWQWLRSQRFADGDPGDVNWWAGQLLSYRKLKKKAAAFAQSVALEQPVTTKQAYRVLGEGKKKLRG